MMRRILGVFLTIAVFVTLTALLSGCESRPAAAAKLFEKGEYQKVIDQYPDLEIARRARAKMAEQLLLEKKFEQVINEYSDTPAAFQAREGMAQDLYVKGDYRGVIDRFPNSEIANSARQKMADSLFTAGDYDQLLQWYPDTDKAKQVKEERATAELAKIKKLKGKALEDALDGYLRSFAGTEASREASKMINDIRRAKNPPPAPPKKK